MRVSFGKQVRQTIQKLADGSQRRDSNKPLAQAQEIEALNETNLALLETLGAVVDSLNAYTFYHSAQVAGYAMAIAQAMGLPEAEQIRIFKAALVHDVGMISISSAAISRAGQLTEEELDCLRLHPTISGEIVGRIQHLKDLAVLVHYHHERYDGAGYPDRLSGDEIPLGARIIALADSVDAMLSGRPNRPARSLAEVMQEVRRCSGSQFDPRVTRAFLRLAAERGEQLFCSATQNAQQDMLLTTLGIAEGRASRLLKKE
jgi:HD-GYP domain-containing protein (c-di-GMP phosphodiesterase class II)